MCHATNGKCEQLALKQEGETDRDRTQDPQKEIVRVGTHGLVTEERRDGAHEPREAGGVGTQEPHEEQVAKGK